jgi:geranylgeranyl pyrophosphate synthase
VIAESGNINAIKEISKAIGTCGTIGGQVADILNKKSDIEYINLMKTAVLFEVAVKSGGIIKGASKLEINALGNFGRNIGLTFQLLDDLKDKDGYVKLYSKNRTKEKAELLAKRAKSYLKNFGNKANALLTLADTVCPVS